MPQGTRIRLFLPPSRGKIETIRQNCQGWQCSEMYVRAHSGCTTVEDGSNSLAISIFPRFYLFCLMCLPYTYEISHRRKVIAKHIL